MFICDENTLPLDSVQSDTLLIPLVEITGLKFTSQSFLIEFALRQVMVLNDITEGEARLISHKKPTTPTDEKLSETMKAEVEKEKIRKKECRSVKDWRRFDGMKNGNLVSTPRDDEMTVATPVKIGAKHENDDEYNNDGMNDIENERILMNDETLRASTNFPQNDQTNSSRPAKL